MDKKNKNVRILVVEDDSDQRQLICDVLEFNSPGFSFEVIGVSSGRECLGKDLDYFDVILLDFHLPDMPGLDLLGKVLARVDVPVIFVTGESDAEVAGEAIRRGASDYLVKLGEFLFALPVLVEKCINQHKIKKENERLKSEQQVMLGELQVKNTQLKESLGQLEQMASTDYLTGLANRRHFNTQLSRYFDEATRYDFDLTCCMCDLDSYKQINDAYGHQLGDQVLVLAAEVICSSFRSSDLAARYGGDEFVFLLPHTSIDRGQEVCQRIRRELNQICHDQLNISHEVTMSIGIVSLEADKPTSAEKMVGLADKALYLAKEQGKNRIITLSREAAEA